MADKKKGGEKERGHAVPGPAEPVEDFVGRMIREWQERLKLGHWTIAYAVVRGKDIEGNAASIQFVQRCLTCNIKFRDPIDYPEGPHKQDMECDVVHELLHLWLAPVQPDSADCREDICFEQAINTIAEALVAARYEGVDRVKYPCP